LNLTIEDITETRKKLHVSFTSEEVEKEQGKILKDFSGHARISGFRPGKAPQSLIQQRYRKELAEELDRKITSLAYETAVKESEMDIFAVIDLAKEEIKPGEEGDLTITVDINPDFDLPDYKEIPTEISSTEVTDKEIDEAIQEFRRQRSSFEVVTRAAEIGDFIKVSYNGMIDNQPIADLVPDIKIYGKQENTWEEAGGEEGTGIKAVVDGLVGMNVDEEKEVEMEFPSDLPVEALAGKKAIYHMQVHEVRERVLPDIDEKLLGTMKMENLDQFRNRVSDELKASKDASNRSNQRQQIHDRLNERIEFSLPESAVESETQALMRDLMAQNLRRGVSEQEMEKHKEEIFQNARLAANDRVKMNLLLSRISEKESIAVDEKDIQQCLVREAISSGSQPEKFIKEIRRDRDRLANIHQSIRMNKTWDMLVENSIVSIIEDDQKDGK